jgi:hypothetical protein
MVAQLTLLTETKLINPVQLRDIQLAVKQALYRSIKQGYQRTLLCAPCAFGKTVLAASIVFDASTIKQKKALFVVPYTCLTEQTAKVFESYGIETGIIAGGYKENRDRSVQIATIQTLAMGRDISWFNPDVTILDECLAGKTLITTKQGLFRIDDPQIIGSEALSFNENLNKWEYKPILRRIYKGFKKTLKITTENSIMICNDNHLIRTEAEWKKADRLTTKDKILKPIQNTKTSSKDWKKTFLSASADVEKEKQYQQNCKEDKTNLAQKALRKQFVEAGKETQELTDICGDLTTQQDVATINHNLKKLRKLCFVNVVAERIEEFLSVTQAKGILKQRLLTWNDILLTQDTTLTANIKKNEQKKADFKDGAIIEVNKKNYLTKLKDLFTALYWEICQLLCLTTSQKLLHLHDLTLLTDSHKKATRSIRLKGWNYLILRLLSFLTRDTEISVLQEEAIHIQDCARSMQLSDPMETKKLSTEIGSIAYQLKEWHGGIATTEAFIEVQDNHNFVANGLLVHNCHLLSFSRWALGHYPPLKKEDTVSGRTVSSRTSVFVDAITEMVPPSSILIGLTATPWRLSKRESMGDIFETQVLAPTPKEMIALGYLVPIVCYGIKGADLKGIRTTAGDYNRPPAKVKNKEFLRL